VSSQEAYKVTKRGLEEEEWRMKKKGRPVKKTSSFIRSEPEETEQEEEQEQLYSEKKNGKRKSESSDIQNQEVARSSKRTRKPITSPASEDDTQTDRSTSEIPTEIVCGVCSLQGERPQMEDTHVDIIHKEFHFNEGVSKNLSPLSYFAVYDGHGGVECANYLEKALHTQLFKNAYFLQGKFKKAFYDVYADVDEEIEPEWGGSTAACALLTGNLLTVANVGDAEIVVASASSNNGGLTPTVLSLILGPDNEEEKQRIKDGGGFVFNGRVNGEVAVSRAFGDKPYKRPVYQTDLISAEPSIVKSMTLSKKDKFILLSCDGLYENGVFNHQQAIDFIAQKRAIKDDPNWIASQLAKEAINRGSYDNVTVIVVFLKWD